MSAEMLHSFAETLSLPLEEKQLSQLFCYSQCIWDKKDSLNLTSVDNQEEIFTRHLADGLIAAAKIKQLFTPFPSKELTIADVGSGAGYIGFTLAIALPHAQITCVESLEKRCAFMNWAIFKTNISNLRIKKARLGQDPLPQFDVVTERAMGQLVDILPICMQAVKPGGFFLAYQGEHPFPQNQPLPAQTILMNMESYQLPHYNNKKRHLALFAKGGVHD